MGHHALLRLKGKTWNKIRIRLAKLRDQTTQGRTMPGLLFLQPIPMRFLLKDIRQGIRRLQKAKIRTASNLQLTLRVRILSRSPKLRSSSNPFSKRVDLERIARHNQEMRKNAALFVTFEGTEGAGKSTLIREVARQLTEKGIPSSKLCLTREPGGTPVAEQIRKTILEHAMNRWTELFLYEASRAEHLTATILPALNEGKIVLCDRFADSSLAYQGFARGIPWKMVKSVNAVATQGLVPDLTVLLDIDPAVGLSRAQDQNRFELEGLKFQQKVRRGFLKARKENPKRWHVIKPGAKTPETLALELIATLEKKFPSTLSKQKRSR
jgi:dTMP kinase